MPWNWEERDAENCEKYSFSLLSDVNACMEDVINQAMALMCNYYGVSGVSDTQYQ